MHCPNFSSINTPENCGLDIDLSKSIMVGDMNSDIEFGKNAGMKTIFIGDNELKLNPDSRFDTLYDFAKMII